MLKSITFWLFMCITQSDFSKKMCYSCNFGRFLCEFPRIFATFSDPDPQQCWSQLEVTYTCTKCVYPQRWLNAQITPPAGSGRNSSPDYNPPSVVGIKNAFLTKI